MNNLAERLPAGSYVRAAWVGLQDTAPRDALIGMHARVDSCEPSAWQHPDLIQTYSPRWAVYVLPVEDFGVFTIGRLPLDVDERRTIDDLADKICRSLDGTERRGLGPDLDPRGACASGRLALRWTTSALYVREVPRPEIDFEEAHKELARRHLHAFGPTTVDAFAWWAGVSKPDAQEIWRMLAPELLPVDLEDHRHLGPPLRPHQRQARRPPIRQNPIHHRSRSPIAPHPQRNHVPHPHRTPLAASPHSLVARLLLLPRVVASSPPRASADVGGSTIFPSELDVFGWRKTSSPIGKLVEFVRYPVKSWVPGRLFGTRTRTPAANLGQDRQDQSIAVASFTVR